VQKRIRRLFQKTGQLRPARRARLISTEQELRDIRYALDQSSIVAITDAAGTITFVNDKFCEISKYSRNELLGQNHRIINSGVHPREFFVELWRTISTGKVWRGEICNRAKDGSLYWVATVIVPFLTPAGRPHHYVAIRTDITERKRAEEQVKKAIQEREEFLAVVAHDLKNPLSDLALNAQLISRWATAEELTRIADRAKSIERTGSRMLRMISEILDMGRIEAEGLVLHWETVKTEELIADAFEMARTLAAARGIQIERAIQNDALQMVCDRERILQVLSNLIGNAIKFSPDGGIVNVEIFRSDSGIEIRVLDSGRGISPEKLPHVFKRFWRSDPQAGGGTGLGLYISKWIVDTHGGRIWVKNRPEGGAELGFWLPAKRSGKRAVPPGDLAADRR